MILERLDRLERHRVHRVGADQLLDVEHVAVRRILRRRRRPQAPLVARALAGEVLPPRPGERLLVSARTPASRSRSPACPRAPDAPSCSRRLSASVSTRETKNDATDATFARIASGRDEPLEAAEIRLDDGPVPLQREDQRDVDRLAARDAVLDRGQAELRRRDLDHQIRAVDLLVRSTCACSNVLSVSYAMPRVDLHRDVAVGAARGVLGRPQHVAGVADVLERQREEDLRRVVETLRRAQLRKSARRRRCPRESAFWKIDGFEVTPVTASSSIIRFNSPVRTGPARACRTRPTARAPRACAGDVIRHVSSPFPLPRPCRRRAT